MSSSAMDPAAIEAARQRLRMAMGTTRKGAARKAVKPVAPSAGDGMNEKIKSVIKKLGMQSLPETAEVVLYKEDDTAIHFAQPKVQVSPHNNCTFISGESSVKPSSAITETHNMMDDIFNRIRMAPGGAPAAEEGEAEVPTLVDDFEAVAEEEEEGAKDTADIDA